MSAGRISWSVIVRGEITEVTDPAELDRLRALPLRAPAPGARDHFVRILPAALTGHQIVAAGYLSGLAVGTRSFFFFFFFFFFFLF